VINVPIIKDRDLLNDDGSVPIKLLVNCIKTHQLQVHRFKKLEEYYDGKHVILDRKFSGEGLPNNKLICNHAAYITDMATGYFIGNPVTYKAPNIEPILNNFNRILIHSVDTELCRDISKYGVGYELIYMSSAENPIPKSTNIDPAQIFLVVDDTVEYKSMFAVHYCPKINIDDIITGYRVDVYTATEIYKYLFNNLQEVSPTLLGIDQHYFKGVPVIEYWNKSNIQGDFEGVITLIDAYNLLQSDRINDKEQLIDALLAVKGVSFGDNEEEMTATAKLLKKYKILEMPVDGDAKWLIKQLREADVEILKKSIKDDIHEFSMVPCLTDENFASQASGVAMKYKLMGLEQLAKTKEGYYRIGLRERLQLYANILKTKGFNIDISDVEITMTRSLPVNETELSQMVIDLDGTVSLETRLGLLPFISDPAAELKRVQDEKKQALEEQQKAFGSYDFKQTKPDGGNAVDEEQ
jgi:SPP1 family phage portal protein